MIKKTIVVLVNLVALTMTPSSKADDDPLKAAIDARKAYMQVLKWNAGPLFAMAKGDLEYDQDSAKTLANNLKTLSTLVNSSMWPEGSDNTYYDKKTRALPEIWNTYPEIVKANKTWANAVSHLSAAAGNGLEELRDKIGGVGKGCKGCHENFRAEDG